MWWETISSVHVGASNIIFEASTRVGEMLHGREVE